MKISTNFSHTRKRRNHLTDMALFLKDLGLSNNEIIEAMMEVVPQELIDDNTGEILTGQFHQRMAEVNAPMITPWRRERNRIYLEN